MAKPKNVIKNAKKKLQKPRWWEFRRKRAWKKGLRSWIRHK